MAGAFLFLRNRIVSNFLPFKTPPILILSYPRSGSSWIGKVLSTSPSAAYLREPITQPYMFKYGGKHALVDINQDLFASSIYRKLSDEAFFGIPSRHTNVVNSLRDFLYPQRKNKRILIKEVNPKAIGFYCNIYKPKVLFLLRHPAAIALSFYRLGWLESPDVQMETDNPAATAWEKFGFAYGKVMNNAIEFLKVYGNHKIVIYKTIAETPHVGFKELFQALDLEIPQTYDDVIKKYCYSSKEIKERGEIERTSRNMIFKWHDKLTVQQISELRVGLLKSQLEYYRGEKDWAPEDGGSYS